MPDLHPETNTCAVIELLDRVDAGEDNRVSIGEIVKELESVGFGPLLLVPAMLGIAVGGIPMLNTVLAILMILIAGQALIGRPHPWLPAKLREMSIAEGKYKNAVNIIRPALEFFEKKSRSRLVYLTTGPAQRVVALLCVLLAISIMPLDILPFAAAVPSAAIAFLALGLTLKDGMFMLAAFVIVAAGAWVML